MTDRDQPTADFPPAPGTDATGPGRTLPESRPGEPAAPHDPGLPLVPGYAVTGLIARGGMGAVYAARDLSLGRDVAVKLVLPGGNAARFVTEAEITARLPHPGIPPVHQLGTLPDGMPFLAMKLIRGRTLAEELAADGAVGSPRLVRVFEQVCEAVAFAHGEGVIHRDIKPANVMVGAFGEVQVMDWGLARSRGGETTGDRLAATRSGALPAAAEVVGTPAYMAPEQARGEPVDARADVFALGGLLCAILTARPPFEGRSVVDTVKMAAAANLAPALERLAACGADPELTAIARRCLSADPGDRPADAGEVAALVADYRSNVEARLRRAEADRAAAEVRVREQRKRRRVQLALVVAVGLLFAAGGAFAWWDEKTRGEQARLENAALVAEQSERQRLARNAEAVGALLGLAEAALRADEAARAAVPLEEARRRAAEGGADHLTGRLAHLRAALDTLTELDRINDFGWANYDGKLPTADAAAAALAEAFRRVGIVPGQTAPADAAHLVNASPIRGRLLAGLDAWCADAPPGDPAGGLLAILREVDPDPYRTAAREAVRANDVARFRELLGRPEALDQPAGFATLIGAFPGITPARREQILRTAHQRQPNNFPVLMTLGGLGAIAPTGGRDDAPGWYRAALAVRPRSVVAWSNLGNALLRRKDADGAVACLREAIGIDPGFALAHYNLGVALYGRKDLDGAAAAFREAARLNTGFAPAHFNLGLVLNEKGDTAGAVAAFRAAAAAAPKDVAAYLNLGNALRVAGDVDAAVAAFREVVKLDPKSADARVSLGDLLHRAKDVDGAVAAFREAVKLDPKNTAAYKNLATALRQQRKYPEAAAAAREAVMLAPGDAQAHALAGLSLADAGDVAGARKALDEAARLDPRQFGGLLPKIVLQNLPTLPFPRPKGP